jgi:hypothetical protein
VNVVSQWPRGLRSGSRQLAYWACGFESRLGHGCLSLVSVVCCQVEVSATGWSLFPRSPTECGVSKKRVWSWSVEKWGDLGPQGAVEPLEKKSECGSLDSSVGIVTRQGQGVLLIVVLLPAGARGLSFLQSVQTGSWTHRASYSVGTGGSSGGRRVAKREAGHSSQSKADIKNKRVYNLSSPYALILFTGTLYWVNIQVFPCVKTETLPRVFDSNISPVHLFY